MKYLLDNITAQDANLLDDLITKAQMVYNNHIDISQPDKLHRLDLALVFLSTQKQLRVIELAVNKITKSYSDEYISINQLANIPPILEMTASNDNAKNSVNTKVIV